jgi:SpoVK/Ycf46/Vps4 family AAA+-type ATPase
VNREAELAMLREEILRGFDIGEQGVFVLVGLPGVGKTMLALECAYQVLELFPDGALCATMGASAEAVTADEVLALLLTQLGVQKLPPRIGRC